MKVHNIDVLKLADSGFCPLALSLFKRAETINTLEKSRKASTYLITFGIIMILCLLVSSGIGILYGFESELFQHSIKVTVFFLAILVFLTLCELKRSLSDEYQEAQQNELHIKQILESLLFIKKNLMNTTDAPIVSRLLEGPRKSVVEDLIHDLLILIVTWIIQSERRQEEIHDRVRLIKEEHEHRELKGFFNKLHKGFLFCGYALRKTHGAYYEEARVNLTECNTPASV